jgi:hypothetical protein
MGSILPYIAARNSASEKQYSKAEKQLARHYEALELDPPSANAYPEANMLFGLLRFRANEFESARACTNVALRQLAGTAWRYKDSDRRYLRAYCSNLLRACEQALGETPSEPLGLDSHTAELDLRAVHPQIRANFPLKTVES